MAVNETGTAGKEREAASIVREALEQGDGLFAFFYGDAASVVLLHLMRMAGAGRVPVVFMQFPPMKSEVYRFANKLGRLWGLDLIEERLPAKPDGAPYTGQERACESLRVLEKNGGKGALSPEAGPVDGGTGSCGARDHAQFRPLYRFSPEDISDYASRHRIPLCSLHLEEPAIARGSDETSEKKAIEEKLKGLGYI